MSNSPLTVDEIFISKKGRGRYAVFAKQRNGRHVPLDSRGKKRYRKYFGRTEAESVAEDLQRLVGKILR